MRKTPNKSFNDWQAEEVEKAFGIKKLRTLPFLESLKEIRLAENHEHRKTLEKYRLKALDLIDGWNEDEFKFLFISPYLTLVDFSNEFYNVFMQRPLSVAYENDTKVTSGKVEWMLARGRQIPEFPHFFLHEYKPEKNRDNDPLGQLLIAMVAAQTINVDDNDIYGIYVNGRNWFWVQLVGKTYAVSLAYDVTSPDIFDLFATLELMQIKMKEVYMKIM
jgi:hypothetical protein